MTKKKAKTKLDKLVDCTRCEGTGEEPGAPEYAVSGVALCSECGGKKVLPRQLAILNLARAHYEDKGTLEFDDNAKVSEADTSKNGAYVQGWVWVPFNGHAGLDRT